MTERKYFVEVILPLPLPGTFTYHVSEQDFNTLQIGQRVAVQFGTRKIYTGIIHSLHKNAPETYRTKEIYGILDEICLVLPWQIKFWEWMADYYMSTLGDVYTNAFPSALKLESDSFIRLNDESTIELTELSDNEQEVYKGLLNRQVLSVDEAAEILEKKSAISVIKTLLDKDLVRFNEKLIPKYKPKIERYIYPEIDKSNNIQLALDELKRAPKQREMLLSLITQFAQTKKPIRATSFLKEIGGSYSSIEALESKDLIRIESEQTERIASYDKDTYDIYELTEEQKEAEKSILNQWHTHTTVLLHGVTSSGKTEIYLKLIEKVLRSGKNVLYLLPEISLTTQLTQRIQKHFGNDVAVYHSKFNQNERVELWYNSLQGNYKIIIGARSSLFLPIQKLGLIIIDEEHEPALKQSDSKPYYNARDSAIYLAHLVGAKVLLGSATPSLEYYYSAQKKRIGYVSLDKRYGGVQKPEIQLIDLKEAIKKKTITGNISDKLKEGILETLKEKKQIIIFQNRRGYAPVIECLSCGHTPFCPNCDVALTFHRLQHQLKCHYCGHTQAKPIRCYHCKSPDLTTKGIGTEQIEEELNTLLPQTQVARMDVDTMRKKFAFEKVINAFQHKEIDILVGTQMVTKGLDFDHVHLVGIVRVDSLLNFPDFRAHERAYQRIIQVAGRAGRRKERGLVLIQSFDPNHVILQYASQFKYKEMAKEVLYERQSFHYPPFVKLIQVRFSHQDQKSVEKAAIFYTKSIKQYFEDHLILGPEAPHIYKMNNRYRMNTLVKIKPNQSISKVKKLLNSVLDNLNQHAFFRKVRIDFDVDPI